MCCGGAGALDVRGDCGCSGTRYVLTAQMITRISMAINSRHMRHRHPGSHMALSTRAGHPTRFVDGVHADRISIPAWLPTEDGMARCSRPHSSRAPADGMRAFATCEGTDGGGGTYTSTRRTARGCGSCWWARPQLPYSGHCIRPSNIPSRRRAGRPTRPRCATARRRARPPPRARADTHPCLLYTSPSPRDS